MDHLLPGDVLPVDIKAVFIGQVADKLALCAPVSLPERMQNVYLPQIICCPGAEFCLCKPCQVVFFCQLPEQLLCCRLYVAVVSKEAPAP